MTATGLMPLLAQQLVEQGSGGPFPPAQQRRPLSPAHQPQTTHSVRAPPLSSTSMRSAQQSSTKGSTGTPYKEKREFVFSWTDEMLAQKYQVSTSPALLSHVTCLSRLADCNGRTSWSHSFSKR